MVEGERQINVKVGRFEINSKQALLSTVMDESRIGAYIDPKVFIKNLNGLPMRKMDGRRDNLVEDIKRDAPRRIELINEYGNESIGHLDISANTLNNFVRLVGTLVEFNPATISGLRGILASKTLTLREIEGMPVVYLPSPAVGEAVAALEKFDLLLSHRSSSQIGSREY